MGDFNINWVRENIKKENLVIFDIGCADMGDIIRFKLAIPNSTCYAFECGNTWKERNIKLAKYYNINYFHMSLSDMDDSEILFYPSIKLKDENWDWSSSIYPPTDNLKTTSDIEWGEPYSVNTITLETFCKKYDKVPDIIHMDVQGAEHAILSKMGNIRPEIVWVEICEFHNYNTNVTYQNFNDLMDGYGYTQIYSNRIDALYALKNKTYTNYYNGNGG